MGHLVGNASEHEPSHAAHSAVPHYDQIGIDLLGDPDERLGGVMAAGIVNLNRHTLAFGLGEDPLPYRSGFLAQPIDFDLGPDRVMEPGGNGRVNSVDRVHGGARHLRQGKSLADSHCCPL